MCDQVKPLGSAYSALNQPMASNKPQQSQLFPQSMYGVAPGAPPPPAHFSDMSTMFGGSSARGGNSDSSANKMLSSSLGQQVFSAQMGKIVGQSGNTGALWGF